LDGEFYKGQSNRTENPMARYTHSARQHPGQEEEKKRNEYRGEPQAE
jgi:hypothetical protein